MRRNYKKYILQIIFIDSTRFMVSSLSNLINNVSEGIYKIKCKYGHDDKKCKTCGIKYKDWECFLEYTNFKDDLTEYKYLCCNENYYKKFHETLKKHTNFLTMITISLFYCCKKVFTIMNIWVIGKNYETSLPEKEDFYSYLNMEDITDTEYTLTKRARKDFAMKHLGEHHDLYIQSDTLLLADVFENL